MPLFDANLKVSIFSNFLLPDSVRIDCAVFVSQILSVGMVFKYPNFEFEPDFDRQTS